MSEVTTSPALNLRNTIGALYVGTILSTILYGITCLQTFFYFQSQNRDSYVIKCLVITQLLIDTAHEIFMVHGCYYYTILNFNNEAALSVVVWSVTSCAILISAAAFLTECFFTWRLYILSNGNKPLLVLLLLLSSAHITTGFAWTIRELLHAASSEIPSLFSIASPSLAVSVCLDSIIFICLVYYLHRNRSGLRRSDSIVNKIIKYAVVTGLVTIINSTLTLTLYAALPSDMYFITFAALIPKLYINSLLTTLNMRGTLREIMDENSMQSFSLSILSRLEASPPSNGSNTVPVEIRVDPCRSEASEMDAEGKTRTSNDDLPLPASNDLKLAEFGAPSKEQV